MSRGVFDGLLGRDDLLGELARLGRLRRAARLLAREEFLEGTYVDEREAPSERQRLAAADAEPRRERSRTWSGGPWVVRLVLEGGGALAIQEAGPPGASLVLGGATTPLEPGRPARVPLDAFPRELLLLGPHGRRWRLSEAE